MDSQLEKLRLQNIVETKSSIKDSVQPDILVISAANSLDCLHTVVNMLSEKLREWFVLYNPEFLHNNKNSANLTFAIQDKYKMQKPSNPELSHTIKDDRALVEALLNNFTAEKSVMGGKFDAEDVAVLKGLHVTLKEIFVRIDCLSNYIDAVLKKISPNVLAVAGAHISARLLMHAGSLKKLSQMPSSTIQVLGAEKALFRHLKKKTKSPKFGVLYSHAFVKESKRQLHGKIARALANKICIAVKIDFFGGEFIGDKLRAHLEKKFGLVKA